MTRPLIGSTLASDGRPGSARCQDGRGVANDSFDRPIEPAVPAPRRSASPLASWSSASRSCATRRSTCCPSSRRRTSRSRPRRSASRPRRSSSSSPFRSRRTCSTASRASTRSARSRVPGLSSIVMVFEPGTDIYKARAARAGAAHAGARAPERLEAAADAPAALVVEPRDDDRALVGRAVADRAVGARALDDPAAPDGRPRRRQRLDLRACATSSSRSRSTRARCATSDVTLRAGRSRPPATRRSSRR